MNRPRVLFVEAYPGFRGAQRSLAALLQSLERDVEVHVLLTAEGRSEDGFRAAGLKTTTVPTPRCLRNFHSTLAAPGTGRRLFTFVRGVIPTWVRFRRIFRRERPDLVHCNESRSLVLAAPMARRLGIPVIWHLRGLSTGGKITRSLLWRIPDRILCVSGAVRSSLPPGAQMRAEVVYNGISPEAPAAADIDAAGAEIAALRAERGLSRQGFTFVSASSLIPYKGLHHMVDSLSIRQSIHQSAENDLWLILGDDDGHAPKREYREFLEGRIAAAGVTPNVAWLGWKDDPRPWFAAADAVVLPTIERETVRYPSGKSIDAICSEGFPRTILEAMTAGAAVIATRVAGVEEQIESRENGLLVPASDPGAIAAAMSELADDPALRTRLGRAAATRVRAFSPEQTRRGVLSAYRELGLNV